MRAIHILLAVQTIAVLLTTLNRLGPWTTGYVAPNQFLRWVDLHNMLTIPLISLTSFYLIKKQLERGGPAAGARGIAAHLALNLVFVLGIYVLGASYGAHEVTNYLHIRFCPEGPVDDLCRIIVFVDDDFSHWVFFTGFVMINAALLLLQALFPYKLHVGLRDFALLVLNGLFIGLGIFANLAFEEIGFDLYVVALLAALALFLYWRRGRQPLVVYYATAYLLGLVGTGVVKLLAP
ncbi:MAG: hypothetical protein H3C34_13160 [Caldilineaceae bacterium]|nr:hypothetical protein [Caldilineaceae bacterium]